MKKRKLVLNNKKKLAKSVLISLSLVLIFVLSVVALISFEFYNVQHSNFVFLFAKDSNIEGGLLQDDASSDQFKDFLVADDLSYLSGLYRAEKWDDIGDFFEDYKYVFILPERKLDEYGLLDTSVLSTDHNLNSAALSTHHNQYALIIDKLNKTFFSDELANLTIHWGILSNVFDIVASDNPFERANSLMSDSPSSLVILDYLEEDISSEEFKWLLIYNIHDNQACSVETKAEPFFFNDIKNDKSITPLIAVKKTILIRFVELMPYSWFVYFTDSSKSLGSDGVADGNDTLTLARTIDERSIDIYRRALTTGNDELCEELQEEFIRERCHYEIVG